MNNTSMNETWTLRDLPFAARFTLAAFLISVGIGYFSALVNMHFQSATPGEALPTPDDVQRDFHGKSNMSQLERLLVAHPSLPFNGQGSMRAAFTQRRVGGWVTMRKGKAKELEIAFKGLDAHPELAKQVDEGVEEWLDGERQALLGWLRAGAAKEPWEADKFKLEGKLAKLPITPKFVEECPDGRYAKINSIILGRCARCHAPGADRKAEQYPLENWEDISVYLEPERSSGKSLSKLAMTTHVHLLAFSLLYGLTGIIFALTGYWSWLRLLLAPLPLLAQVVDISFWWLARLDEPQGPMFAQMIPISGGVVALGLGLQILLTLFYLFGKSGKVVLLMLVFAAIGTGFGVKDKVFKYLDHEKNAARSESIAKE